MPSFRLLLPTYINRAAREPVAMQPSGTTIHDYDGPPGKSLQAIDDVGRSAIRIPRDFASLHGKDRIWLARQLGASEFVSIVEADGLISDEVRKREQAAIEMKG